MISAGFFLKFIDTVLYKTLKLIGSTVEIDKQLNSLNTQTNDLSAI